MPRIRGADGKFTAGMSTAERDAEACRMRTRAMSYSQIAHELGYADEGAAHTGVRRALARTVAEPAEDVRRTELARLDHLYASALAVLERAHVTVSQGRVVSQRVPGTGTYDPESRTWLGAEWVDLLDDAPVLAAIDRLLKIQDRRAKLLGLDAPTRVQVMTVDVVDAEIARLTAELGSRPAGQTPAIEGTATSTG